MNSPSLLRPSVNLIMNSHSLNPYIEYIFFNYYEIWTKKSFETLLVLSRKSCSAYQAECLLKIGVLSFVSCLKCGITTEYDSEYMPQVQIYVLLCMLQILVISNVPSKVCGVRAHTGYETSAHNKTWSAHK